MHVNGLRKKTQATQDDLHQKWAVKIPFDYGIKKAYFNPYDRMVN